MAIQIMIQPKPTSRKRSASDAWLERYNPLRGLSIKDAQWIFDAARTGNYALLHWLFSEIEKADPILMTCVERRTGNLAMLGPKAVPIEGLDPVLAAEQCDMINRVAGLITNLPEALEHLDLAFFRGFAHVMPLDLGGQIELQLLNSWNFCYRDGRWLWNPNALSGVGDGLEEIDSRALVTVRRPRLIDYPAMAIFLRSTLGERDWGRFIERYGLPPCIITLPQIANEADAVKFAEAAEKVANGLSGSLPYGSTVNFATEARGTDPFTAFIDHQQKLTVLMCTGGTLTSLAEAGTGTLAGNAQMSVWNDICERDAAVVASALDRAIFRPALSRLFPGKPVCARFELETQKEQTPEEVLKIAAAARAAGYTVDQEQLEAKTGLKLVPLPQQQPFEPGFGAPPLQNVANPLQNVLKNSVGKSDGSDKDRSEAILRALARDVQPASDAVIDLIASGMNVDKAKDLVKNLNTYLPTNPESANLIADEIAKSVKGKSND